ncbi:unnamed protein product [Tuber aestivum]|uniref:Uncharacterized protein n=1 Tax=Tuber aestivum TaxID=59557 RepID=A0A292PLC7_9PEZI|nr:unnamed protein product [Tuber aestivum]
MAVLSVTPWHSREIMGRDRDEAQGIPVWTVWWSLSKSIYLSTVPVPYRTRTEAKHSTSAGMVHYGAVPVCFSPGSGFAIRSAVVVMKCLLPCQDSFLFSPARYL